MHSKEPLEYRLQSLEERMAQHESTLNRKVDHLEERLRQVNMKFDRIEQLGDRLESLNNLFDQLKNNFDAKLQIQEDKLNTLNTKYSKLKQEDFQQLYALIKKAFNAQKEFHYELQQIKDIRYSEVLLKQSNVLGGDRLQSPNIHQRIESCQKNDRLRSITLEKEKMLEQRLRQATEGDDLKMKARKVDTSQIDKFQFTLKGDENNTANNQIKPKKSDGFVQSSQQSSLLERTISQEHFPKQKYLNANQLKNLRK